MGVPECRFPLVPRRVDKDKNLMVSRPPQTNKRTDGQFFFLDSPYSRGNVFPSKCDVRERTGEDVLMQFGVENDSVLRDRNLEQYL